MKNQKIINVIIVLSLLFTLLILTIIIKEEIEDKNEEDSFDSNIVLRTKEYQIRIYPQYWANRTAALNEFYSYFEELTSTQLKNNTKKSVRTQTSLTTKHCNNYQQPTNSEATKENKKSYNLKNFIQQTYDPHIRIRKYVYGENEGMITIDGKISFNRDLTEISSVPKITSTILQPSHYFQNISSQKIEYDVHPCHQKLSRETKLSFHNFEKNHVNDDYRNDDDDDDDRRRNDDQSANFELMGRIFDMKVCGDLNFFFPNMIDPNAVNAPISYHKTNGWISFVNEGHFQNRIKFKSDLTMKYETVNGALYGNEAPIDGEFSFRIWSSNDGHGEFDSKDVELTDLWYHLMIERFGSFHDYPCQYPVDIDVRINLQKKVDLLHLPPPSFGINITKAIIAIENQQNDGEEDEDESPTNSSFIYSEWDNPDPFLRHFNSKL